MRNYRSILECCGQHTQLIKNGHNKMVWAEIKCNCPNKLVCLDYNRVTQKWARREHNV